MTRVPESSYAAASLPRWRLGETPWRSGSFPAPKSRVIIDNDFSGDPDDLFQIVHHLLSPSVAIKAVIASHLRPGDPMDPGPDTARNAELVLSDVFDRMGLDSKEIIFRGSPVAIPDTKTPLDSPAVQAIIAEAMREDSSPLFYAAGGGLTDLASALLIKPEIAKRMTLIWIGGSEHAGIAVPPLNAMPIEYNLLIDVNAARVVFANPDLTIWQIPRDVYRQCLVSDAELRHRVAASGRLGEYLYDEVAYEQQRVHDHGLEVCESYALGDSPLVLLTALRSTFEPDASSSFFVERPTPEITSDGAYRMVAGTRPMRIYTAVDVRLMFEDFYLKLKEFCRWQEAAQ